MIAPELIIGLKGRFVPFCSSIELKTSPLGSTPTCSKTFVGAEFLDRHAVGEWLGDRLNGERPIAVAGLECPAVGRDETDPERVGVGLAQLGDVCGDFARVVRQVFFVDLVEQHLQFVTAHEGAACF